MTITVRKRKNGTLAYGVSVWDGTQQKWIGTFDNKTDAREAESHDYTPTESFNAFADEWLANSKPYIQPTTYDNYRFHLAVAREHFGDMRNITARDCERFAAFVADRYAPLSARSILITVEAVLRKGEPTLPKMRKPNAVREHDIHIVAPDEMKRLRSVAGHYRLMLSLWPLVGLRPSEMWGLQPGDIQADGLHVERQIVRGKIRPPKYGSKRIVPLTSEARQILAEHETVWNPHGWLFTTEQGTNLCTANFGGRLWQEIRSKAKLDDLRLHDLRHTFASLCLAGGLDVLTVSAYLGHKDSTTTLRTYAHLIPSDADEKAARLEAALKAP